MALTPKFIYFPSVNFYNWILDNSLYVGLYLLLHSDVGIQFSKVAVQFVNEGYKIRRHPLSIRNDNMILPR